MNTKSNDTIESFDRYRTIKYQQHSGPVTIIQDTENDNAWIQSDITMTLQR